MYYFEITYINNNNYYNSKLLWLLLLFIQLFEKYQDILTYNTYISNVF